MGKANFDFPDAQGHTPLHYACDINNFYVVPLLLVTGFYPKLKSFWSCSHMNCCQQHMLHINLHILYILFIKLNFDLKEFQVSNNNYFKSYQENKMKFLDELYFNLNLHSNLNIKSMNQILFHVMPC